MRDTEKSRLGEGAEKRRQDKVGRYSGAGKTEFSMGRH